MRYWVYINDKVDGPHNESELVTLRGFTPDTLICSEESASSGNQQWMKASSVFEFDQEPVAPGGLDPRTKDLLFSKLDALMDEFAQLRSRLNDMEARLEQKIEQVPDATIGKTKLETISNAHSLLASQEAAGDDKLENTTELVAQAEDMVASANQEQTQDEPLEPAKDDLILQSAMDSMYNAQLAERAEDTFQDLLTPVQAEQLSKEAEDVVEERVPAETTPTEEEAQRDALIKEITVPENDDVIDRIIEEKNAPAEDEIEDLVATDAVEAVTEPENKEEEPAAEEPVAEEQAEELVEQAEEPVAEEQTEELVEQAEEPVAEEQAEEPAEQVEEPVAEEQAEEPVEQAEEPVAEEQAEEPVEQAEEQAEEKQEEGFAGMAMAQDVSDETPEEAAQEEQPAAEQEMPSLDEEGNEPQAEPAEEGEGAAQEGEIEEIVQNEEQPQAEEEKEKTDPLEVVLSATDLELAQTDLSLELNKGESLTVSGSEEPAQEEQPISEEEEGMVPLSSATEEEAAKEPESDQEPQSFTALFDPSETADNEFADQEESAEEGQEEESAEEQPEEAQAEETAEEQTEETAEENSEVPQAPQAPVAEGEEEETEQVDPSAMTEIQLQEGSTYLISDFVPSADPEQSAADQLGQKDAHEDTFASQDVQDMLASFVKTREDEESEQAQTENNSENSVDAMLNLDDPLKDRRGASYDIRTVPMVQDPTDSERLNVEALSENDDINAQHEVKSAQGGSSDNLPKIIVSVLVALVLAIGLYFVLAFMHLLPEGVNVLGAKKPAAAAQILEKELYEEEAPVAAAPVKKALSAEDVVDRLQAYTLPNGKTLQEFVEAKHAAISPTLMTWNVTPTANPDEYIANIKIPPATPQSFKITYRFNYNVATNTLVPTISDSKNLMAESRQ